MDMPKMPPPPVVNKHMLTGNGSKQRVIGHLEIKQNNIPANCEDEELKYERTIVDRTKLGIRDGWPNFIITELQIFYYQSMYDQIKNNGTVIQTVDSYGLGMLAFNMALVDDCNYSIANHGMNMEYRGDRKMVLKRNPALDVLKDAQASVRFYLKEFKMTPTSRGKILGDGFGSGGSGGGSGEDDGFDKV